MGLPADPPTLGGAPSGSMGQATASGVGVVSTLDGAQSSHGGASSSAGRVCR
jgi:hypothetical protein